MLKMANVQTPLTHPKDHKRQVRDEITSCEDCLVEPRPLLSQISLFLEALTMPTPHIWQ